MVDQKDWMGLWMVVQKAETTVVQMIGEKAAMMVMLAVVQQVLCWEEMMVEDWAGESAALLAMTMVERKGRKVPMMDDKSVEMKAERWVVGMVAQMDGSQAVQKVVRTVASTVSLKVEEMVEQMVVEGVGNLVVMKVENQVAMMVQTEVVTTAHQTGGLEVAERDSQWVSKAVEGMVSQMDKSQAVLTASRKVDQKGFDQVVSLVVQTVK